MTTWQESITTAEKELTDAEALVATYESKLTAGDAETSEELARLRSDRDFAGLLVDRARGRLTEARQLGLDVQGQELRQAALTLVNRDAELARRMRVAYAALVDVADVAGQLYTDTREVLRQADILQDRFGLMNAEAGRPRDVMRSRIGVSHGDTGLIIRDTDGTVTHRLSAIHSDRVIGALVELVTDQPRHLLREPHIPETLDAVPALVDELGLNTDEVTRLTAAGDPGTAQARAALRERTRQSNQDTTAKIYTPTSTRTKP